ncbi:DNA polymerase III subunit gamma/tau [Ligilactobacillus ruminis]|uniref:DNA-directed DNA polymerase n=1 Tax=Ligilactobacillus ruminis TaxID=1623 RepID=A0A6A8GRS2_9LACO|nr:DNA polymerase III subunit gamma/tau [Ligilactobacillus ruminis]MSA20734.1 DNA polymerase III subunit gamma/tau [Ligilactobacillus ruminis]MSA22819.1 DNA polymerase III subunit gamma/tau [Ligilactobacillus ruminis]MSA24625.1 DNA polymerase III subunit gamma/tau [Ligilactobacillus ruminis]MSA34882.1 DNA polymerase III subunit gamma/tau [Ligilactobacillus ruminis]MSA41319.1 DNA polymerase III subunit gamma/tau [Ligilactobacillus ruminis]
MSYQALYRVWRPQTFEDLVGQDMITKTLKNALATKQTTHAYLFAGPRGTGKTSCAKLFAKALNCPNQVNGDPCNECETCKAITAGRLNDVIEIDAASNNGVEEIRDIRDKVKYAPTQADYKVYIIDEVHMLSTSAFNALLKTLEEPPENVVFILATTDPHKIPATIISRTQRFDFKRITSGAILERMEYILKQKQFEYDEKALNVIARAAEGGMRDALSILDQVLSFGDNKVTLDNALLVTGSVTRENLIKYLSQVQNHETVAGLQTIHAILDEGKDSKRLLEDLINCCRDLLLYKQAPEMLEQTGSVMIDDEFKSMAEKSNPETLYRYIDTLNEQQENMRYSMHQSVYLEVLTVKLAKIDGKERKTSVQSLQTAPETLNELNDLQRQVKELKDQVKNLLGKTNRGFSDEKTSRPAKKTVQRYEIKIDVASIYRILGSATKIDKNRFLDCMKDILSTLNISSKAMFKMCEIEAAGPEGIILSFNNEFICGRIINEERVRDEFENSVGRIYGDAKKIVYVPKNRWLNIRQEYIRQMRSGTIPKDAAEIPSDQTKEHEDDIVQEAEDIFGKDLIEIKED